MFPPHHIIWVNGTFKGKVHDLTIARSELFLRLGPNEKILGDKAYIDQKCIHPFKGKKANLSAEQIAFNAAHSSKRQAIERINSRVKIFRSVKHVWRHGLDKHHQVFLVVCNLVNMMLKTEAPLDTEINDDESD